MMQASHSELLDRWIDLTMDATRRHQEKDHKAVQEEWLAYAKEKTIRELQKK